MVYVALFVTDTVPDAYPEVEDEIVGAAGVPTGVLVIVLLAPESPNSVVALIHTAYDVPFVKPVIVMLFDASNVPKTYAPLLREYEYVKVDALYAFAGITASFRVWLEGIVISEIYGVDGRAYGFPAVEALDATESPPALNALSINE